MYIFFVDKNRCEDSRKQIETCVIYQDNIAINMHIVIATIELEV